MGWAESAGVDKQLYLESAPPALEFGAGKKQSLERRESYARLRKGVFN
jgi:hypothetical protein